MGIYWKTVHHVLSWPGLSFEGDPDAQNTPFLWRFQWKWALINVENIGGSGCCHIFFATDTCARQYRWPICTPYIAVRIGPSPVTFWAEAIGIGNPKLRHVPFGRVKLLSRRDLKFHLSNNDLAEDVTWV